MSGTDALVALGMAQESLKEEIEASRAQKRDPLRISQLSAAQWRLGDLISDVEKALLI